MPTQRTVGRDVWLSPASEDTGTHLVSDESVVLRNYDDDSTHEIQVTFTDHNGEVIFFRTVSVTPRETVDIQTRLDRAVYRVDARLENGATARADCLLGSDPGECAIVETGNGLISVVERSV